MAKKKLSKTWTAVTPLSKFLAMALFIILPFVGFYLGIQYQKLSTPSYPPTRYMPQSKMHPKPVQTLCTQEAKQCPDGSYVGRTGPQCEFAACPQ